MNDSNRNKAASDLPEGLAEHARRGLMDAGFQRLDQLTRITEAQLKNIHGIGPNDISLPRSALAEKHLSLADDQIVGGPTPPDRV